MGPAGVVEWGPPGVGLNWVAIGGGGGGVLERLNFRAKDTLDDAGGLAGGVEGGVGEEGEEEGGDLVES